LEIVGRWRVSEESEQSGLEEEELVVLQMAGELAADEWQKAVAFVVEDDILKDDILFQRNCGDSYGDGRRKYGGGRYGGGKVETREVHSSD
jgi:hypothetical protein